jgi:alpha-L-rhamnosidase
VTRVSDDSHEPDDTAVFKGKKMMTRSGWMCGIATVCIAATVAMAKADNKTVSFASARPVWVTDRQMEKNLFVGFRAIFDSPAQGRPMLRITASSLYRVSLNGQFVGHGPARGPHGYCRVDEWPLDGCRAGRNVVAVEVAGYNVNSYYLLDEPAFLQAEVVCEGTVLASTAGQGAAFDATILSERVQKVQRYSFQRPFIEYYRLNEGDDRWWEQSPAADETAACSVQATRSLLVRRVAYPRFFVRQPARILAEGTLTQNVPVAQLWKDRSLVNIGEQLKGYPENELEVVPSTELQKIQSTVTNTAARLYQPGEAMRLAENTFAVADLGTNLTGFVGADVACSEPAKLYITFDEVLTNGDVDFKRLGCVNAVCYELQPGTYRLESFEPYTLRYLKVNVLAGDCKVTNLHLREYVNGEADEAQFSCSDPALNRIFEAARQTFRQNAVDIFMDCPSRERAGWLCDSFFTSRVAFDLCGNTTIEKNFFENYLLPPSFAHLPEGMLPMCYPADHYDGVFIPNWAIWFVLELEEYQARSGDRELVMALRPRLEALYNYFQQFKNSDGLVEKLQSWVFVEWSAANGFVQDVSYPSNMLYAAAVAAAARMYDEPALLEEAEQIRETIRRQSFDGEFFVDNAVRKDGKLEVTRNRTEVCQYFAFFFDVATPQTHSKLWDRLANDFGPQRKTTKAFPEVHPANAFVGNYLRFELLSRYGRPAQIKKELSDYYLYMADRTGTLWENIGAEASCNHGFASHVAHSFYRDVLGVKAVDAQKKVVTLSIADVGLDWCDGKLMTPQGPLAVRWWKDKGQTLCHVDLPAGYVLRNESPQGSIQLQ